jgi:hypothetical protein
MSKKAQRGSGVMASDMSQRDEAGKPVRSEILDPVLYYRMTAEGKKRYRLAGVSAKGTKMSAFISADVAEQFGAGS